MSTFWGDLISRRNLRMLKKEPEEDVKELFHSYGEQLGYSVGQLYSSLRFKAGYTDEEAREIVINSVNEALDAVKVICSACEPLLKEEE